jgi:hypothetical protein
MLVQLLNVLLWWLQQLINLVAMLEADSVAAVPGVVTSTSPQLA